MKKLLAMSLLIVPFAGAMELEKAKEVKVFGTIEASLKNEALQQARAQEIPADLATFFAHIKTLDTFFEMLRSCAPLDAATSTKWQSLKAPLVHLATSSVTCRNTGSDSLSKIQCLGITIRQCSDLVRASKGSEQALSIARKSIPKAAQEVQEVLEKIQALEKTGVLGILQNMPYILELLKLNTIGLEAAIAKMLPLQKELFIATSKLKELLITLNAQKEEAFFWTNCMHVFETKIHGEQNALKSTRERYAEIKEVVLSQHTEQAITALFPKRAQYPVKNDEVAVLKSFMDALGIFSINMYKNTLTEDRPEKEISQTLCNELTQLRSASLEALKKGKETCAVQVSELLETINTIQAKLDALQNPYKENPAALSVIRALQAAQNLSQQDHYAQPLVAMIECVERMVSPCVKMLSEEDRFMTFLADRTLNKYVGLLHSIANQGGTAMKKL